MSVFFWITDLLIPATMIVLGLIFKYHPPKEINRIYGYRTPRSMKSQEAWDYAHKRTGEIWPRVGVGLFVLIVLGKLILPFKPEYLSLPNVGIGLLVLIAPIPVIERELKNKFDGKGYPVGRG